MPRSYLDRQRLYSERGDEPTPDAASSSSSSAPPPPDTARGVDNHGLRKSTINALLRSVFSPSPTSSRVLLDALIGEGFQDADVYDFAEHLSNSGRTLHTLRLEMSAKERHDRHEPDQT